MPKTRILVVDDSVVVRRLVADLLASDPALEVVATAANGRIALDKLAHVRPDLVILDVEMPELDGLQTLAAIRQSHPRLPVLMFSQHTHRGAAATLDALAAGANDYLAKPDCLTSGPGVREQVREQLVAKISGLFARTPTRARLTAPARPAEAAPKEAGPVARVEAIAIGVSTGGPNALSVLLPALPADLAVPVFVVQHMPPLFTKLLAQRLARECPLPVAEATDGEPVLPGRVFICPGDFHLQLARDAGQVRIGLTQGPPENSCRPSVDVLFRSAAAAFGPGVLGIVLTGMGQDGLRGCERIREAGGQVLVQDESTSVVWGMPGTVARAGLADQVLPLDQLASQILTCVRRGRTQSSANLLSARL